MSDTAASRCNLLPISFHSKIGTTTKDIFNNSVGFFGFKFSFLYDMALNSEQALKRACLFLHWDFFWKQNELGINY